jgi:hypothetical protein
MQIAREVAALRMQLTQLLQDAVDRTFAEHEARRRLSCVV